jgi:hypothetical protein
LNYYQHKGSLRGRSLIDDARLDSEINVEIAKEDQHLLEERGDNDATEDDVFGVANGDGGSSGQRSNRHCSVIIVTHESSGGLSRIFKVFEVTFGFSFG